MSAEAPNVVPESKSLTNCAGLGRCDLTEFSDRLFVIDTARQGPLQPNQEVTS
jgi:hypothetical protein